MQLRHGTSLTCTARQAPCVRLAAVPVSRCAIRALATATFAQEKGVPIAEQQKAIEDGLKWFRVPPKVYFKGGCLEVALAELRGLKRALIVTDQTVYDLALADHMVELLDKLNIQNQVFTHVGAEVTAETVAHALREVKDFRPDAIIALGGGAPMDAAKIVWMLYEVPTMTLDQLIADAYLGRATLGSAPIAFGGKSQCICVPTTSGTGAEVTPFAVIKDKDGRKVTLANYSLTPSMAIVDPQLVLQLPKQQTAYGGQLTLAHAIESYISRFASHYTRAQSKHAMSMLSRYYQRAYLQGAMDVHAREKMHNAATVAGMAFANTYLGLCHALASEISVNTNAHLGLVSGVLLPHVVAFVANGDPATKEMLSRLSDHLHVGGVTTEERYKNVHRWIVKTKSLADIPDKLTEALGPGGVATIKAKEDVIVAATLENAHLLASPVTPTAADIKSILRAVGL